MLIRTNLTVTSTVLLLISAFFIVIKIADASGNFATLMAKNLSVAHNSSLPTPSSNSQSLDEIYVPPNYGSPDSQYGSGTR